MDITVKFDDGEITSADLVYLQELIDKGLDYTGVIETILSKLKKGLEQL